MLSYKGIQTCLRNNRLSAASPAELERPSSLQKNPVKNLSCSEYLILFRSESYIRYNSRILLCSLRFPSTGDKSNSSSPVLEMKILLLAISRHH